MYAFKTMTDVLFNYSEDSMRQKDFFAKTQQDFWMTRLEMTVATLVYVEYVERWLTTRDGKSAEMKGPIYCDILQQKNLFLNNMQIRIKLTPSLNAFVLMGKVE